MMIPIRCMSCGTPIAGKWERFKAETAKGKATGKVLDDLGLERYCCRATFLTQVDLIDEVAKFKHRMLPREEPVETKAHESASELRRARPPKPVEMEEKAPKEGEEAEEEK